MSDIQSHLARYQPMPALGKAELLLLKAKSWSDYGILVVSPDQFTNPIDRQMVASLGDRLYGRRANG